MREGTCRVESAVSDLSGVIRELGRTTGRLATMSARLDGGEASGQ